MNDHKEVNGWYHYRCNISELIGMAQTLNDQIKSGTRNTNIHFPGERHPPKPSMPLGSEGAVKALAEGYHANIQPMEVSNEIGCLDSLTCSDITYDVSGMAVDVGTYLSGEPECMINVTPGSTKRRVSIAIAADASGDTSADTIERVGRHVSALIRGLEDRGYEVAVDVYALCASDSKEKKESILFEVKEFQDPFNGDVIDYVMSVNFYRWGEWAMADKMLTPSRSGSLREDNSIIHFSNRGYPINIADHIDTLKQAYGKEYDIVIPSLMNDTAAKKVIDAIQAFRPK